MDSTPVSLFIPNGPEPIKPVPQRPASSLNATTPRDMSEPQKPKPRPKPGSGSNKPPRERRISLTNASISPWIERPKILPPEAPPPTPAPKPWPPHPHLLADVGNSVDPKTPSPSPVPRPNLPIDVGSSLLLRALENNGLTKPQPPQPLPIRPKPGTNQQAGTPFVFPDPQPGPPDPLMPRPQPGGPTGWSVGDLGYAERLWRYGLRPDQC